MKKYKNNIKKAAVVLGILFSVFPVMANAENIPIDFDPRANDTTKLLKGDIATGTGLGTTAPTLVAINLVNVALSLLGSLCVILLIYGGFLWVWARGNSEEVEKAKKIVQGTIIGLIIVLAALGITQYVFTTVANISGATPVVATE